MSKETLQEQIKQTLGAVFKPLFLEVTDDSSRHHGHAGAQPGGETHFKIRMAAAVFSGRPLIQRHQAVYSAMDPFFKKGMHALQMDLFSPEEWHARTSR